VCPQGSVTVKVGKRVFSLCKGTRVEKTAGELMSARSSKKGTMGHGYAIAGEKEIDVGCAAAIFGPKKIQKKSGDHQGPNSDSGAKSLWWKRAEKKKCQKSDGTIQAAPVKKEKEGLLWSKKTENVKRIKKRLQNGDIYKARS